MRTRFSLAFTGALLGLFSGAMAQDGQRLEDYLEQHGQRQLHIVQFIDQMWPGEALNALSENDFVRSLLASGVFVEGRDDVLESVRTFRYYQNVANGISGPETDWFLERTRPVPKNGPYPYVPIQNFPDAVLAEAEPNDTLPTANPMTCADFMTGQVAPSGDPDYFQMILPSANQVTAQVAAFGFSPLTNPTLELQDAVGTQVAFNDNTNGLFPQLQLVLPPGTYYWVVSGSGTSTGEYIFLPTCQASVPIDCTNNTANGSLLPGEGQSYLVTVPEDIITLTAAPTTGTSQLELELLALDGTTVIGTSQEGTGGGASITTGLRAGSYTASVRNTDTANTETFTFTLTCLATPLPNLNCNAPPISQFPSQGVWPTFNMNVPTFSAIQLNLSDLGDPDAARLMIEDTSATVISTLTAQPNAMATLNTFAGPGLTARLKSAPTSGSATWRDTDLAKSWCRPTPTVGPYAGPSDETVSTTGGFNFVDGYIDGAGMLRLRMDHVFNTSTGAWDMGYFIDQAFIEVDYTTNPMPGTPVQLFPVAINNTNTNGGGFSTTYNNGMVSDVQMSDGVYWSFHMVDSSAVATDTVTIELVYNLSALAITGSQLTSLRSLTEWYFAGNSVSSGSTIAPPTSDDSSEEDDVVTRELQLNNSTGGTWDRIADIAGGSTLGLGNPQVDLDMTCSPLVSGSSLSAEDRGNGDIQPGQRFFTYDFSVRSTTSATFRTNNFAAQEWDGDQYAQRWSTTAPTPGPYVGPVNQSVAGPLLADVVSPTQTMRIRFRQNACWPNSTAWDTIHYYDVVTLTLDLGAGPQNFAPTTWIQAGDVGNFISTTQIDLPGGTIADIAMMDGAYGRSQWNDHDSPTNGVASTIWDEFDFDVSSILSAGGGASIQSLGILMDLYLHGSGFNDAPTSTESSEEQFMTDMDVEMFDFNTSTWLDVSTNPIIDPTQYATPPNCTAATVLDPEMWIFDQSTLELLGNNDDSGAGNNAQLTITQGDTPLGLQTVLVVIGASDFALAGEETGPFEIAVEASAGYAGSAPFEVQLNEPLTFRVRGNDGERGTMYHSISPHFGVGIPLGGLFEGFLVINLTGFRFITPDQLITNGVAETSVLIPNDPSLRGFTLRGQALVWDFPGFSFFRFSNEDSVTIR